MNAQHDLTKTWAALDLGSNSFHLLLARPVGASFVVEERLKEKVQLVGGFSEGRMQADAQARGLACLARFAQRLKSIESEKIIVMGTCAFREATNVESFTSAARDILPVPIEVISGDYEAELIYCAVAHYANATDEHRLVLDIGGGSTEFALGSGANTVATLSVNMGCVAWKDQFFTESHLQGTDYWRAKQSAADVINNEIDQIRGALEISRQATTPLQIYGTSGTIESIHTVLNANGWSRGAITREAMVQLENAIAEDGWVLEAGLPGLAPDRADIFPAGVAILSACFDALDIDELEYVDVSLLQGIICDKVLGTKELGSVVVDLKEDSVAQLTERFAVERTQAARVANCAAVLYAASGDWWQGDTECADLLRWAAQLHELGVHISARHYHRHGAYIVKHAELAGFSQHQQSVLALLIRGHRRSMPGLSFRAFDPELETKLLKLVALLRLAVILQRSHSDEGAPKVSLSVTDEQLTLDCGVGWLAANQLSYKELQVERRQQATAGLELHLLNTPK